MEVDYSERMLKLSDEQLLEIIQHHKDYLPEALQAAELELKNRNIPNSVITSIKLSISDIDKQSDERAKLPLTWDLRILLFLIPFGFLQILLASYYEHNGFKRKGSECWRWMFYGLSVYAIAILFTMVLK